MKKKYITLALTLSLLNLHLHPTTAIGDENALPEETFSFNIGHAVFNSSSTHHRLWLASGQDLSAEPASVKKFGLSYVDEISAEPMLNPTTGKLLIPTARPLANNESATIYQYDTANNKVTIATEANPIYGSAFSFFDVALNNPAFVVPSSLEDIYLSHEITLNKTELLKHSFQANDTVKDILSIGSSVFAAHSVGNFGSDSTSKITKLSPTSSVVDKKTVNNQEVNISVPYLEVKAEVEITTATEALRGGGAELTSIQPTVTLNNISGNLYVGLNVTASSDGSAGIVIAKNSNLTLLPIASNNVISGGIDTVVSASPNNQVSIKQIAEMKTSSRLSYLIVARDSLSQGTENAGGSQSIYAIPMVSQPGSNIGQVADFNEISNTFISNRTLFHERYFTTALKDPNQINPNDPTYAEQLTVGQGQPPVNSSSIKDLYVVGDSVYIVIDQPYATNQKPGTFCSQAIFAQDGHIISWTPWSRVLGSDDPMLFSNITDKTSSSFYVANSGTGFKKVVQTQWLNSSNLAPFFKQANKANQGTQGIFNFSNTTQGFNNELSLLIATGFNQVTIGQTGFIDNGNFKIKPMSEADVVTYNVSDNQAIIAAELAHNNDNHWLFVGGASGVAVLTNEDGITWSGNLNSIEGFTDNLTFNNIGNFSFVKKLVYDDNFLYILTNEKLEQITLNPNQFTKNSTESLNVKTIIESSDLPNNGLMLDVIIDNGFCILGTTNGMHAFDINTAGAINPLQSITIPDGLPATSQLIAISKHTEAQRNFSEKSNLYVLNNTFGTQEARLNRFTIENKVIKPFNDIIAASSKEPTGSPTSFIKFNNYTSNYFTNGSWNFATSYFLGTTQPTDIITPSILQIFAGIHTGKSNSEITFPGRSGLLPASFLSHDNNLLGIKQESTSGALIMAGNFEARVTT